MSARRIALIFDDQARPETTGVYCRRALGSFVDVEHFRPDELGRISQDNFDVFMNVDDGLHYRLPARLRPCIWWAIDTHLDFDWCREKASDFDLVFAAQRDGAEQLKRTGIASAMWLPLGCDPDIHRPHAVSKTWDFCFVGNLLGSERTDLIRLLQRRYPRCFVGQRYFDEMARTYSEARTVFNRSIRNDVNMRVFEAVGCGSLLLTNDLSNNGQDELFRDGVHLATYNSTEELLDKVSYYLLHETVRERIAAAGRTEAHGKHTYRHRMESILAKLKQCSERSLTSAAGSRQSQSTPSHESRDPDYFEFARPELLERIPRAARRVLDIGCAGGRLGESLKARQPVHVTGVEVTESAAQAARTRLDEVLMSDVEKLSLPADSFDAIVCGDVLEHLREPVSLVRKARDWLTEDGVFIASIPNVRHQSVVRGLLDGNWTYEPAGLLDRDHLRFFTRREIEKLFFRAGFEIHAIDVVPGPGYDEWVGRGRPGEVNVGSLHITGLPDEEAEEFYVYQYLITARRSAPANLGLTSIVIPVHNQLEYTRLCIESIRQYTDEPYELIAIDNGSTDGTAKYLDSLADIKVIRNPENRGFPVAANQGMRAAQGEQILLLNNDTIVTTGWLNRLLRALHSDSQIGLAGPCSNCVGSEQQVEASYEDLSGLDGFAWNWGKQHRAVREESDRLIGFCLAIRRAVVDRIGLLDERFGLGCFDDDDYCKRAQAAGFRAVIARDVFIHHFGGRTFIGMGVDFAALMQHNQKLFAEKWSSTQAKSHSAKQPSPLPSATPPLGLRLMRNANGRLSVSRSRIRLSLCMIVRDNSKTLAAALASIKPWVDEIIVIDTGSKDDTPAIAERMGARVYHFPWPDSFSAARNESLKYARGEWVFWMDSDDTISAENGRQLRELAYGPHQPSTLGYVMQVHCPGPGETGWLHTTIVDHVKLFRNRPDLRFTHRIHEQILPAIADANGYVAFTEIFVTHTGYDHSPEGQERKKERDLHLLHLELAEQPDHPFTLFNLGMTYADIRQYGEAIKFLQRSIANSKGPESHLRKAYALLAYALNASGETLSALDTCTHALKLFVDDLELRFRQAVLFHELGRLPESIAAYQSILANPGPRHLTSMDPGMRGFKARQNLAIVFSDVGNWAAAEAQWRNVVREVPEYTPGWRGLGEALVRLGRHKEAEELKVKMAQQKGLEGEVHLLRSRIASARLNFKQARRELDAAVRACPDDLDLAKIRTQFLFEQADWPIAQQALEAIIQSDPEDAAAHHNLGTVLFQRGDLRGAINSFSESLRLRPNYAATNRQLGHVYYAAGRIREARSAWTNVLRVAPGDPEATAQLRSMSHLE
jgi:glycosyltransferase involved in cell wall biosynthesis/2-polyprenyl-3-methyl-5-hydroxy-6-metoxy-1,4-benzoquinol methylase